MIASILERVERGELKRVIISVPPRHWKSSLASEKFPAWYLGRNPQAAVIISSYALSLAEKFSRSVRETITSNTRYAQLFDVRVKRDSNRSDDWTLTTGVRSSLRAVGVGGGITGSGAQLILIDDPVADYEAAQSETQRNNLWEWYRQVLRTRLEPGGAIVLIQTRWHEDDLAGRLIRAEQEEGGERWTVVNLPAQDLAGNYLWTDRYSAEEYQNIRASVGEYAWRSLYQGQPSLEAGTEILREWFEFVPQLPEGVREQCRVVDTAWTLKKTEKHDPDYTASIASAVHDGWLYLIDPYEVRQTLPATVEWVREKKKEKPYVRFGMAKAAGEQIATQFLTLLGIPITELTAERVDLRVRLAVFTYWARRGRVKLVGDEKKWERFLSQATAFPNGTHDDLLAVCSGITEMHHLKIDKVVPTPKPEPAYAFVDQM